MFSNVSNESLIKVIDSLKRNGEIVTSIGNNIEDIDILKNSNISITNNNSIITSASHLTINDNNLETIINCIKISKNISNVIYNITQYLFFTKIIEVLIILLTTIFKANYLLSIIHLLWIDLSACILSLGLVLNNNIINDDNYIRRIVSSKKEALNWILASILSSIIVFIFVLLNSKFNLIQSNTNYFITIMIIFIQSILLFYYENETNSILKLNLKDKWKLYLLLTIFPLIQVIILKYFIQIKITDILIAVAYSLIPLIIIKIIKFIQRKSRSLDNL